MDRSGLCVLPLVSRLRHPEAVFRIERGLEDQLSNIVSDEWPVVWAGIRVAASAPGVEVGPLRELDVV